MSKTAHILAIARGSLGDLGFGVSSHPGDIAHVFEEGVVWIGPRPALETDENFVQPIPYILLKHGDRYLVYRRAAGDHRLKDKFSMGFGGHVDAADTVVDANGVIDLQATMMKALARELAEEVSLDLGAEPGRHAIWSHVITCTDTPVDRVHVGLAVTVDLAAFPDWRASYEPDLADARFMTLDEILEGDHDLESWTRLMANKLVA